MKHNIKPSMKHNNKHSIINNKRFVAQIFINFYRTSLGKISRSDGNVYGVAYYNLYYYKNYFRKY